MGLTVSVFTPSHAQFSADPSFPGVSTLSTGSYRCHSSVYVPVGTQDVYCFIAPSNSLFFNQSVAMIRVSGTDGSIQTFNFSREITDGVLFDSQMNFVAVDAFGSLYAVFSIDQYVPEQFLITVLVKYNAQGQLVNFTSSNNTLGTNTAYGLEIVVNR